MFISVFCMEFDNSGIDSHHYPFLTLVRRYPFPVFSYATLPLQLTSSPSPTNCHFFRFRFTTSSRITSPDGPNHSRHPYYILSVYQVVISDLFVWLCDPRLSASLICKHHEIWEPVWFFSQWYMQHLVKGWPGWCGKVFTEFINSSILPWSMIMLIFLL